MKLKSASHIFVLSLIHRRLN